MDAYSVLDYIFSLPDIFYITLTMRLTSSASDLLTKTKMALGLFKIFSGGQVLTADPAAVLTVVREGCCRQSRGLVQDVSILCEFECNKY